MRVEEDLTYIDQHAQLGFLLAKLVLFGQIPEQENFFVYSFLALVSL